MKKPTTEDWEKICHDFWTQWNIPNCIGAVDGKHVRIRCPSQSGSLFYNYKKYFSAVLMAVSDANYKFIFVDVGAYGCEGDSSIFQKSDFCKSIESGSLALPRAKAISPFSSNTLEDPVMNHFFVGDDAFPLKSYLMKPFPGKNLSYEQMIFNYRLSRARRVVENAFGILAAKFRIFHTCINTKIETVDYIILASCIIHNFLLSEQGILHGSVDYECEGRIREGEWRRINQNNSSLVNVRNLSSNNYTTNSSIMRNQLKDFFSSAQGKLLWQDEVIRSKCT